jgi:uncharacterized protein (DUF1015 family)
MAEIKPFRAMRYTVQDVSKLIAPPYDVLDEKDKARLLDGDDHNIVALDLPHVPPKTAGPDRLYDQAAGQLTSWLDIRCLGRDEKPALYVYHQHYELGGRRLTRKKFFARLRLEQFGKGAIFAHEETFGGPKEDRLKLTAATRCNMSPIFGLYPDPQNEVAKALDEAIGGRPPDQTGLLQGVENALWVITEPRTIKAVQAMLAERSVFVADGHHRYSTALMYRAKVVEEMGEPLDDDPVNFVLAALGGMEDPGATIQPYFRSLVEPAGIRSKDLLALLSKDFECGSAKLPGTEKDLASLLSAAGPSAMGLYFAGDSVTSIITPKSPDLLASLEPTRSKAWQSLAYSILHRYVIEEVIAPRFNSGKPPVLHYHKSMSDMLTDVRSESGVAFLMPATTMQQLRDICTAGELMPQKSTYFHPKIATGMVINPLYD